MYPAYKNLKFYCLILLASTSFLIAQSGNIKTITDKAVQEYENGNYSVAIKDMERALNIMKQKQGKELNSLLPKALPGWTKGKRSSQPMDPRGIVSGQIVEQTYNKGNGFVTATLILEAPMVKDIKQTLNNPQLAQNRNGAKIELISNKKALVRYQEDQREGEISMLVNSTTVAVVYGKNISLRDLKNYAKTFKFSKISKIK
ncbi:MAG: hypothetical protein GWP19_07810 [Planctomycetia bacterium]|nr:hypothetical protein [Planctomycetia bacterium]